MTTTTVEQLPVKITASEKALKSAQLVNSLKALSDIEDDKKNAVNDFTQRAKEVKSKVDMLAHEIRTGEEMRPVECFERPLYSEMVVELVRGDTGDIVSTRGMHPTERQHAMEFEGDVIASKKRGKRKSAEERLDGEDESTEH